MGACRLPCHYVRRAGQGSDVVVAAEDIRDGYQIDTAPEWLADAGIGWENKTFSAFASLEYVGEYFTNAANTAKYDGHTLLHLRGAWRFNDKLEAFTTIRNVTDERYADRADFASGVAFCCQAHLALVACHAEVSTSL